MFGLNALIFSRALDITVGRAAASWTVYKASEGIIFKRRKKLVLGSREDLEVMKEGLKASLERTRKNVNPIREKIYRDKAFSSVLADLTSLERLIHSFENDIENTPLAPAKRVYSKLDLCLVSQLANRERKLAEHTELVAEAAGMVNVSNNLGNLSHNELRGNLRALNIYLGILKTEHADRTAFTASLKGQLLAFDHYERDIQKDLEGSILGSLLSQKLREERAGSLKKVIKYREKHAADAQKVDFLTYQSAALSNFDKVKPEIVRGYWADGQPAVIANDKKLEYVVRGKEPLVLSAVQIPELDLSAIVKDVSKRAQIRSGYAAKCYVGDSIRDLDFIKEWRHPHLGLFGYGLAEGKLLYNQDDESAQYYAEWFKPNGNPLSLKELIAQRVPNSRHFSLEDVVEKVGLKKDEAGRYLKQKVKRDEILALYEKGKPTGFYSLPK